MDRKWQKIFLVIFLSTITHGLSWAGAEFVQQKDSGLIDWTAGIVEARGVGSPRKYYYDKADDKGPKAIAAAANKARHNLLETVVKIRINDDYRVIDIIENYPTIMAKLKEMVYDAPEMEKYRRYLSNGTVEVWAQISLRGGFLQLILPPEIRQIEPIKQVSPKRNLASVRKVPPSEQIFSGLIVDARGVQLTPALSPKILDENFSEVFGPAFVSREFAVQNGMVSYTHQIRKAQTDERVFGNPLVVKAIRAVGSGRCDLVISNAHAAKLKRASEHLIFLKECRVIIVTDPL